MSDALVVEGLSVSYGRVRAVRDVSFRAPAGSLVTLVGANGAGKTSTLSAVAGLLKPRTGRVTFLGDDVTRVPAHRLVGAGLVLVPEGREILAALTVHENLQLGGWQRPGNDAERIEEMYRLFPVLADRRGAAAGSLSGGEQQMLAIARALVAEPKVLLMDEPSMGLAPRIVDDVFRVITEIRATGTTVVLVEQNARRALRVADYGYVMETGEVVHEGSGADLLADERVVQAYLGMD
jgi:branched-chain amino acid transport system ATP-binding protein